MEFFFFFAVVYGCGGSGLWLVAAMVGGCGGQRCWVEKERDRERQRQRERGRIKNDKERIFK